MVNDFTRAFSTGSMPTPTTRRQIMCSDQEPQPSNPRRVVHSHHSQEQDHMEVPLLTGPASMISGAAEEPTPVTTEILESYLACKTKA